MSSSIICSCKAATLADGSILTLERASAASPAQRAQWRKEAALKPAVRDILNGQQPKQCAACTGLAKRKLDTQRILSEGFIDPTKPLYPDCSHWPAAKSGKNDPDGDGKPWKRFTPQEKKAELFSKGQYIAFMKDACLPLPSEPDELQEAYNDFRAVTLLLSQEVKTVADLPQKMHDMLPETTASQDTAKSIRSPHSATMWDKRMKRFLDDFHDGSMILRTSERISADFRQLAQSDLRLVSTFADSIPIRLNKNYPEKELYHGKYKMPVHLIQVRCSVDGAPDVASGNLDENSKNLYDSASYLRAVKDQIAKERKWIEANIHDEAAKREALRLTEHFTEEKNGGDGHYDNIGKHGLWTWKTPTAINYDSNEVEEAQCIFRATALLKQTGSVPDANELRNMGWGILDDDQLVLNDHLSFHRSIIERLFGALHQTFPFFKGTSLPWYLICKGGIFAIHYQKWLMYGMRPPRDCDVQAVRSQVICNCGFEPHDESTREKQRTVVDTYLNIQRKQPKKKEPKPSADVVFPPGAATYPAASGADAGKLMAVVHNTPVANLSKKCDPGLRRFLEQRAQRSAYGLLGSHLKTASHQKPPTQAPKNSKASKQNKPTQKSSTPQQQAPTKPQKETEEEKAARKLEEELALRRALTRLPDSHFQLAVSENQNNLLNTADYSSTFDYRLQVDLQCPKCTYQPVEVEWIDDRHRKQRVKINIPPGRKTGDLRERADQMKEPIVHVDCSCLEACAICGNSFDTWPDAKGQPQGRLVKYCAGGCGQWICDQHLPESTKPPFDVLCGDECCALGVKGRASRLFIKKNNDLDALYLFQLRPPAADVAFLPGTWQPGQGMADTLLWYTLLAIPNLHGYARVVPPWVIRANGPESGYWSEYPGWNITAVSLLKNHWVTAVWKGNKFQFAKILENLNDKSLFTERRGGLEGARFDAYDIFEVEAG